MNRFLFLAFFSIVLVACSNKQLYQVGQDYQKSECIRNAVSESQHYDCLNRDKKSYEEYEEERKQITEK